MSVFWHFWVKYNKKIVILCRIIWAINVVNIGLTCSNIIKKSVCLIHYSTERAFACYNESTLDMKVLVKTSVLKWIKWLDIVWNWIIGFCWRWKNGSCMQANGLVRFKLFKANDVEKNSASLIGRFLMKWRVFSRFSEKTEKKWYDRL